MGLLSILALTAFTDDGYRTIFCTVHGYGEIYTVGLRVPKTGGGPCRLISASPSVISGPAPVGYHTSGNFSILTASPTYRTNFAGKPAAPVPAVPLPDPMLGLLPPLKDIGAVMTLHGQSYLNCSLLAVEKDGAIIFTGDALRKILFIDLAEATRKRIEAAR
ncbi:MAG: hypothetical protein WDO13_11965 [Verrucomicrobiota bacterium]